MRLLCIVLATALAVGCVSQRVRQISSEQAKACTDLGPVRYFDGSDRSGMTADLLYQIGTVGLERAALARNGNALVITRSHSDAHLIDYQGEAYQCP